MSELVLPFTYRIGSTLTDLDSEPKLSDPTATFGVKRTDTSAVVVADGTDMERTDVGSYEYTIDDPVPGVTYLYWVEYTKGGVTLHEDFSFTVPAANVSGGSTAGTVTITIEVEEHQDDPQSIVLSSLTRLDTDESVTLPSPSTFTHNVGEDNWTLTFNEPARSGPTNRRIDYFGETLWTWPDRGAFSDEMYIRGNEPAAESPSGTVGGFFGNALVIRRGDSYGSTSGLALTFAKPQNDSWPSNLASWTVVFSAAKIDKGDGTASSSIGPITCTVDSATTVSVPLTAAQTGVTLHRRRTDDVNGWEWDMQASSGSLRHTLGSGTMTVLPEVTTG